MEEKHSISCRFVITYRLPNCIGIDSTFIILTESPKLSGEDFTTFKVGYGVNTLVVCDTNIMSCFPTLDDLVQHMKIIHGRIATCV